MHIISSLLLVLSANMDNIIVGLSYGIKKVKIGPLANLLIAVITLIGTVLSMALGKILLKIIPENIENSLGSIILLLIGLWTIIKPLTKGSDSDGIFENPEKVDIDRSSVIDAKESIILALALTLNNIGIGVGASITGLNIVLTSLLTFVASILTITLGYFIGSHYLARVVNKRTAVISGLLIIILAIYELFI